jgi:hypothetical protein
LKLSAEYSHRLFVLKFSKPGDLAELRVTDLDERLPRNTKWCDGRTALNRARSTSEVLIFDVWFYPDSQRDPPRIVPLLVKVTASLSGLLVVNVIGRRVDRDDKVWVAGEFASALSSNL